MAEFCHLEYMTGSKFFQELTLNTEIVDCTTTKKTKLFYLRQIFGDELSYQIVCGCADL